MTSYLVQDYIDNSQKKHPERLAVSCGNSEISYNELCLYSNQLANCLIHNGISRQDRIVFIINRSIDCIVSIFGILKADAIYVPIDPKSPLKRIKLIIDDCQPGAIICDSKTVTNIIEVMKDSKSTIPLIITDSSEISPYHVSGFPLSRLICRNKLEQYDLQHPVYENIDTDIAYIIYTSGSTGQPKGVMISHLNITNYIDWAVDYFDISSGDCILNTAPFHFDMSTFDIFSAAKSSASLCIAQELNMLFPNTLIDLIEERGITVWKAISSLIMYLAKTDALQSGRMPLLKKVLFGGETLATRYLNMVSKRHFTSLFFGKLNL